MVTRGVVAHRRALAVVLAALCLVISRPRLSEAHPLHTTIAEVRGDRARGTVRATVRIFGDDFATAVQRSTRGRVKPDAGAAWEAASLAYVTSAFGFTDASGRAVVLRSCGVTRVAALLWVCLEGPASDLASLKVRDTFLCELFDDQVNVVQVIAGTSRRSLLFTRGDGAKPLT